MYKFETPLIKGTMTLPPKPFSSTDRMVKHVNELAGSLQEHERAIFLQVYQYRIIERKERLRSTHYEEVAKTIHDAVGWCDVCKGWEE